MLRLMLNRHSRLRVPRESWFLLKILDAVPHSGTLTSAQAEKIIEIIEAEARWADWEPPEGSLREAVYGQGLQDLSGTIDRIFRLCCGMGTKERWGDKTPWYSLKVLELAKVFPTAKFIHIHRDARDVLISMKDRGWYGRSIWRLSAYWKWMTDEAMKGRALGPSRYIEVAYEDLVRQPRETLLRICGLLEEPFEESMLTFYESASTETANWENQLHVKTRRPPSEADLERWRKELSSREVFIMEALVGDSMDAIGQKRRFTGPWTVGLWVPRFFAALRRMALDIEGKVRGRLGLPQRADRPAGAADAD